MAMTTSNSTSVKSPGVAVPGRTWRRQAPARARIPRSVAVLCRTLSAPRRRDSPPQPVQAGAALAARIATISPK